MTSTLYKYRWFFYALAATLLLNLIASMARAEGDDRWVRPAIRSSCDWWELDCRKRRHYHHRTYRRATIHYHSQYRDIPRERDDRCRPAVTAVGEEKYERPRAQEASLASWMEAVRRNHGGKYMDPKNARHLSYECNRSSTGNRASEKTADLAGRYLEQCEVRAQPCRADREDGR